MSLARAELPTDPDALRAFALACQAELKAAELAVQLRALEIEKLKFQIAKLRRMHFCRSSERITRQIEQLALQLEELETGEAEDIAKSATEDRPSPRKRPKRKPLPEHLPRHEVVHQPEADGACVCPDCGAGMAKLGEDVTEVLDYVPGRFQVIRHVRPKYACKACDAITQAPAPALLHLADRQVFPAQRSADQDRQPVRQPADRPPHPLLTAQRHLPRLAHFPRRR